MSALVERDAARVFHPYAAPSLSPAPLPVVRAEGVLLELEDGRQLIDGMSSWWSVLFGYRHPTIMARVKAQLDSLPHVMFGGLTHEPAVQLSERLCAMAPGNFERAFLSDSGSVAVEVAIKLALQTFQARGEPQRKRLLALRGGYHGDTFGAMSVCDPVTGMHSLFEATLAKQLFAPRPMSRFGQPCADSDLAPLRALLEAHAHELAAVILEPIVQGAGGMWFYSAEYLREVRALCDAHGLLLIADEIATGFGRSGTLFACEHAGIAPDILCVGKALTGGTMTLAATLASPAICDALREGSPGVFMHGPTFMGNPLACAAALGTLEVLDGFDWQARVSAIETQLRAELAPAAQLPHVREVRALGAIGVIELESPIDMAYAQAAFAERGVWVRPFGRLVYVMPPYVIATSALSQLTGAMLEVVSGAPGA